MDGEANGTQEEQGGAQEQAQGKQATPQQVADGAAKDAFEQQIAERDAKIAELEAQVAQAAKSAEAAEALRGEIAELKAQGESDRIDFELQLAGCRNVKAARAILDDHGGDVAALREAEPWLFAKHGAQAQGTGKTGLPNAGAASDEGKQVRRWRKLAGLAEGDGE